MKISALEEYGLRCLLCLAQCKGDNSLTINEIAEHEGLSIANVRKLMMVLREAGLVHSVRGRTGGYALSDRPENVSVGRVMELLGGHMYDEAFCGRHAGDLRICVNSTACSVRSLWGILDGMVSGVLHRIRLADLSVGESTAVVNLRRHLEMTIEELLGREGRSAENPLPIAPIG